MLIVPIVHFKRPFGDMSAFEIDMARIIGQEPPASDPHFNRLYLEMWPALQAFVQHAEIPVRPDAAQASRVAVALVPAAQVTPLASV
jgi:hypothetical protein